MSLSNFKWAILGTGTIANEMAVALNESGRQIYCVASKKYENALKFSEKHQINKVYKNYHQMLSDPEVDIVYIATPHSIHYECILEAVMNKKHVLCEKAITMNDSELQDIIEKAESNHVIVAEAMTIYHMPIYNKIKALLDKNELGRVKMIEVNFGSFKEYDENNRFFNKELAGGALLDMGVYALAFVCNFMEEAPSHIVSDVIMSKSGVDEQSGILLRNRLGQMAIISLAFRAKQSKKGIVVCEKGYIEVDYFPRSQSATIYRYDNNSVETIECGEKVKALQYEIVDMENYINDGKERFDLAYTKEVMKIMTSIRKQWGLIYSCEKEFKTEG